MCHSVNKNDPLQVLPHELIANYLAPIGLQPNSSIFRVSKLWNTIFSDLNIWSNLVKGYSFVKKSDPLIESDPRRAYIISENTKRNIRKGLYEIKDFDLHFGHIENLDNSLSFISENNMYRLNEQGFELCKTGVLAFTYKNNKLVYLSKDYDLIEETLNGSSITICKNIFNDEIHNKYSQGILPHTNQLLVIDDSFVYVRSYSPQTYHLKFIGANWCKVISDVSRFSTFNDQLVVQFASTNREINFYDKYANLTKTLFSQPNSMVASYSPIKAFAQLNDKFVSAGYNPSIKIWNSDGSYTNWVHPIDVSRLGVIDGHLVSCGSLLDQYSLDETIDNALQIWKDEKNHFEIGLNVTPTSMAIKDDKILLAFEMNSLTNFTLYDFGLNLKKDILW
ncbi:MAG: hypothetical protein JHC93_07680 [Parachlamydiales bacterium]|nr:hypothetical protein [Parachlamydiales bacterium]